MTNEAIVGAKGINIELRNGKNYSVKPLTINELINIWPIIKKLEANSDQMSQELLEDMITLAKTALGKQITEADNVGDLVDMSDLQKIIPVLVGQSVNIAKKIEANI